MCMEIGWKLLGKLGSKEALRKKKKKRPLVAVF